MAVGALGLDDVLLHPEVLDDEVLPLGRVLAHVEREQQVAIVDVGQRQRLQRMSSPMNALNSPAEISPRPLKRVISAAAPSLPTAACFSASCSSSASPSCCARGRAASPR